MNLDGKYKIHVTVKQLQDLQIKFDEYKLLIGDNPCFITHNDLGDLVFGWSQDLGDGSSSITYVLV